MGMTQTDRDIHELVHVQRDMVKAFQAQNALLAKIASELSTLTETTTKTCNSLSEFVDSKKITHPCDPSLDPNL